MNGAPGTPDPRKAGARKGCIILAIASGVIALLCAGAITWMGYTVATDPDLSRAARAVGAGVDLAHKAMTAPGTGELRRAGCEQAMALSPEDLARFLEAIEPDAAPAAEQMDMPVVTCNLSVWSSLSCEEVARIYAGAVTPAPPQMAVQVAGTAGTRCTGVYDPSGARLGDIGQAEQEGIQGLGPQ